MSCSDKSNDFFGVIFLFKIFFPLEGRFYFFLFFRIQKPSNNHETIFFPVRKYTKDDPSFFDQQSVQIAETETEKEKIYQEFQFFFMS